MFEAKEIVQKEIGKAIDKFDGHGLVLAATGSGKTKIAIDHLVKHKYKRVLWVTPSEQLRDIDTPEEFTKWNAKKYFENHVKIICYHSLHKIENEEFDIVVLDEAHKITELRYSFFQKNRTSRVLAFTATEPHDEVKKALFDTLQMSLIYELDLEEAVERGVVAPYELYIVPIPLSSNIKITAGGRKPYKITEKKYYLNFQRAISRLIAEEKEVPQSLYMRRMNFLYNLESKAKVAKAMVNSFPKDKRILIFSKRKAIAEYIHKNVYHSSSGDEGLNKFRELKVNVLSVVDALNEGVNLPKVDIIILNQLNAKSLEFLQKIGRGLRLRKGHRAQIYLLVAEETKDEDWVANAMTKISSDKIKYLSFRNYIENV